MAGAGEWVKSGDRSHPNLKLIDKALRRQLTYSGYEDDLSKLEEFHLSGNEFCFERTLHKVRESQKVSVGDRSHPRLVKLDALGATLTYKGWEKDRDKAEEEHLRNKHGWNFDQMIEGMKRKQAMHNGDRTHKNLQFLDTLSISYPGWKTDAREAFLWHVKGYDLTYLMRRMREKQRMFEGVRTHPRLVALDSLRLSYPGWQKDVNKAEKLHLYVRELDVAGMTDDYGALLANLSRKQREMVNGLQDTSFMNTIQRKIVETHWTYPGWQDDVRKATESHYVGLFKRDLEKCQIRQMLHDHDFGHHPALIKLGRIKLSYPGWQADVEKAKVCLSTGGYSSDFSKQDFDGKIKGMKRKQDVFNGIVHLAHKQNTQKQYRYRNFPIFWNARLTLGFGKHADWYFGGHSELKIRKSTVQECGYWPNEVGILC